MGVSDGNLSAAQLDTCLAGVAQKDPSALAELYRLTSAPVYSFALSVLKNAPDAEDVLHTCYVHIYAAAAGYRSAGKPMAWILTIAKNLCRQKLREYRRTVGIPEEDWERYFEGREGLAPEERLLLADCMARLSDEERQIVALHAVSGFKHREIAAMLDLPLPTVLSKYNRALKKLKAHFTKGDQPHEAP